MPTSTLLNFPAPPIDTAPFEGGPRQLFTNAWQRWFLSLQRAFIIAVAPGDAFYLVTQGNAALTNAINLGALTEGYLRIAVAAGIATGRTNVVTYDERVPVVDVTLPANTSAIVAH